MEHILIVGGTKGLGNAIAKTLNNGQTRLTIIGRRRHNITIKEGRNVQFIFEDLCKPNAENIIIRKARERNGKINHIVFCHRLRKTEISIEEEMDLTISSSHKIITAMSDNWSHDKNRSILFTSSLLGKFISNTQDLPYHIGRAAIEQMAKYYAVNLGPKGIRVNIISPYIYVKEETEGQFRNNPAYDSLVNSTPLKTIQHANDIANLVEYLCSTKASIITGNNFILDGGYSLTLEKC